MGLHDGGSSYVLAQLKAEERTIMRVERNVLRIALSGGKCNGDGGCGAVFKL